MSLPSTYSITLYTKENMLPQHVLDTLVSLWECQYFQENALSLCQKTRNACSLELETSSKEFECNAEAKQYVKLLSFDPSLKEKYSQEFFRKTFRTWFQNLLIQNGSIAVMFDQETPIGMAMIESCGLQTTSQGELSVYKIGKGIITSTYQGQSLYKHIRATIIDSIHRYEKPFLLISATQSEAIQSLSADWEDLPTKEYLKYQGVSEDTIKMIDLSEWRSFQKLYPAL